MKTQTLVAALALVGFAAAAPAVAQPQEITPPRLEQTAEPVFPAALVHEHAKGGHARLVLQISATGTLDDVLVVSYTARGFADEALWAVKRWRYEPARIRGERVSSHWELLINFEPTGTMVTMIGIDSTDAMLKSGFVDEGVYRPRRPAELDRPLVATKTVSPAYTKELQDQGLQGEVTVDFYIDETGSVRMPSLPFQDQIRLGGIAGAALRQWKFEPPTVRGRPVLVKARQTFRFKPSAAPSTE